MICGISCKHTNCHCHLPFLASLKMANCDVQTSYGGLKVSEFNQESISDVLSLLRESFESENKLFCFVDNFLCISPSTPDTTRRDAKKQVPSAVLVFLGLSDPPDIQVDCHW